MCADLLWDVPEDQLERAVTNAKSAPTAGKAQFRYWKDTATHLDSWARIIVPALYFLSPIVIFHLSSQTSTRRRRLRLSPASGACT